MKYKLIIPGQNSATVKTLVIKVIIMETTFLFPITTSLCVHDIVYCCGQLSHCVRIEFDIWTFIRFNLIIMFLCLHSKRVLGNVVGAHFVVPGWVYKVHFYTY